jgi:hypothetical protein
VHNYLAPSESQSEAGDEVGQEGKRKVVLVAMTAVLRKAQMHRCYLTKASMHMIEILL